MPVRRLKGSRRTFDEAELLPSAEVVDEGPEVGDLIVDKAPDEDRARFDRPAGRRLAVSKRAEVCTAHRQAGDNLVTLRDLLLDRVAQTWEGAATLGDITLPSLHEPWREERLESIDLARVEHTFDQTT